ncbi:MAG: V-type ATP synthase subunit D [Bacilli bacterium]|nr:V-type ATP synthase subunit D [Bacilli bacterium]MCH4235516.1 V-type ATP synthase subunit D [Bacilli bacterium]
MMNTNVIPTKGNLMALKKSQNLAIVGQSLMDRKKNILVREMLLLLPKVVEIRDQISSTYAKAYMALQEANITLGIVEDIAKAIPIDENVHITYSNVMGVDIPVVSHETQKFKLSYGLRATNTKFDYAYQMFQKARDLTITLAEIDNAVYKLANAIRHSQKRANALKNVVIPNLTANIKYIGEVLEERDREEFVRMKVIKANKLNDEN